MKRSIVLCLGFAVLGVWAQNAGAAPIRNAGGGSDPALLPPVVLSNPTAEYRLGARIWQGIPGIERAPNGRLWAVWYSGGKGEGPGNFLVLETSNDDGATWSEEKLVVAPPKGHEGYLREFDPCLWLSPNGKLWLFWAQDVSYWDGRGGVWAISTDAPGSSSPSWSQPRRLFDGILLNKPIVGSSGAWLFPVGGWKNIPLNIPADVVNASQQPLQSLSHPDGMQKASNVFESTDMLRTVHLLGQAQVPDTWFDEHMVVERKDGSLWMLVRTTYGMGQAVSPDGKNWTPLGDSGLSHVNSRFFIRRLQSGSLLLVSNLPLSGTSRTRMTAHLSTDDGKTWNEGLLLDAREQVAYPDGVQAPDGKIFVVYDHDRQGTGQIMLAVFDEADIRAGHIVSTHSRLTHVVNELPSRVRQDATQRK
jgi:predicted neuraminidase